MKALYLLVLTACSLQLSAGQVLEFKQGDHRLKVYKDQTVNVQADSAYVISIKRAAILNQKLQELQAAHASNQQLLQVHRELLDKVREIERLTTQLLAKIRRDKHAIELNMNEIIAELDRSIVILKSTNAQLQSNNEELHQQLAEMERTVKHLRKQIRRIWWKSTADKILVAVLAFGVGLGVGSL
jgi:chromosome segregation ATPase